MVYRFVISVLFVLYFTVACNSFKHTQRLTTYTNPLLERGADPYSFYKNGYYYYTHTQKEKLGIWKTNNLANLRLAEYKTIWTPPIGTQYSKELWAPQIQFLRGKWYMYFAADDGKNENHRIYVLENSNPDPMKGQWIFKGKVADPSDKWAIDADVFEINDQLYMIWSGWEGDVNGMQHIYIAKMSNPWTIQGERVRLSSPSLPWEKHGYIGGDPEYVYVNEGPQYLRNMNKIFIVYSANGCWTDYYTLGMLSTDINNNLLDSISWKKALEPVFSTLQQNGVYAAGHNSFFKSPDGKEDWILYHANDHAGQGCGTQRKPRAQRFFWNTDGSPNFGHPVPTGEYIIPTSD